MHEAWTNGGTRLWLIGEFPEYLHWCQVDSIAWKSEMLRVCPYCGSDTNGKCPNCGGAGGERVHYRADKTQVLVSGILPAASRLFFLPTGSTMEILHKCCGRRDEYLEWAVIFRFLECEVQERRIGDVMSLDYGAQDYLRLNVKLECTAELVLGEQ